MLDAAYVPALAAARRRHLGADHKATSTTIVVAGLVRPEWRVEIDVVAGGLSRVSTSRSGEREPATVGSRLSEDR